ncbi:enoyl-CoA hydratase [Agrobacterium tumefaciens]|uniref:Enoyl-CoA hydratase n=1 Tax=Agrobacterium tumefaciens TaxID=358 RepID=A0A0D0K302_AGRTU|nr:enoyl-CoA hydratase [Agrobacterium tumefaciens]MBD8686830.1 MaoC family dehydratase [Rhizobium sp. CFBP 13644]MBD8691367.1 MaoC family dehydratase [Rhizobium sp. CFBP 13717]
MKYAFEDFTPGRSFPLGPKTVTADEIIEFAMEFDPQPMHLSEEAGKASILGGLAASGWHTCGMLMRMTVDSYMKDAPSQAGLGVDFVEWKKPVLADDTLSGTSTVVEQRVSRSRPDMGVIKLRHELQNQRGETVCVAEVNAMLATTGKAAS